MQATFPAPSWQHSVSLLQRHKLTPYIGVELEWYVAQEAESACNPASNTLRENYINALQRLLNPESVRLCTEQGQGQLEAIIIHSAQIDNVITHYHTLKQIAHRLAESMQLTCCFTAKPFAHDYGNGLHLHLDLVDTQGASGLHIHNGQPNILLASVLHYLLKHAQQDPHVFLPTAQSYARLTPGFNAPTHYCWGLNNRSVMLRLPELSTHEHARHTRHIEHRLAGADADIEKLIDSLLHSCVCAAEAPSPLDSAAIYGNAWDAHYAYLQSIR